MTTSRIATLVLLVPLNAAAVPCGSSALADMREVGLRARNVTQIDEAERKDAKD